MLGEFNMKKIIVTLTMSLMFVGCGSIMGDSSEAWKSPTPDCEAGLILDKDMMMKRIYYSLPGYLRVNKSECTNIFIPPTYEKVPEL